MLNYSRRSKPNNQFVVKSEYCMSESVKLLLMLWYLASLCHRQRQYSLYQNKWYLPSTRKDSENICPTSVLRQKKIQILDFTLPPPQWGQESIWWRSGFMIKFVFYSEGTRCHRNICNNKYVSKMNTGRLYVSYKYLHIYIYITTVHKWLQCL